MQVGRGMTGRSIAIMHISNVSTEELLEKRRSFVLSKEVRQHRLLKIDILLLKTGSKERVQHSNNLGTRRKKKKRKPKNHLKKEQKQDGNHGGCEDRCT